LDRTSGEGETLEQRTRTAHRLYLTALMRLDVLEDDGRPAAGVSKSELANAQVEHTHQFKLLNLLLVQLGYVPKGLATRAEILRELAEETIRPRGRSPERTAGGGAGRDAGLVSLMRAASAPNMVTKPATIMPPSRTVIVSV
jgi:hypothetical protein